MGSDGEEVLTATDASDASPLGPGVAATEVRATVDADDPQIVLDRFAVALVG